MDRCNATRDLSPCNNCNGPECSERLRQPQSNREWLDGLSNGELVKNIKYFCPPTSEYGPRCETRENCADCWIDWLNRPAGKAKEED